MLQSKQYSGSWYLFDLHVFSSVPALLSKCIKELIFLVMPEDTTDNAACRYTSAIEGEAGNRRSTAKAVFWIVIAIILSLSMGQLR